jgi:Protein of unknown function (DUF1360)
MRAAGTTEAMAASTQERLQDVPPFRAYADEPRPLGGYAALMAAFGGLALAGAAGIRRSRDGLPDRVAAGDLVLAGIASQKASRVLTRDLVTSWLRAPFTRFEEVADQSEVEERPRGHGLQRAIGELVTCPFCMDMWMASAFSAGLMAAPRATRALATPFVVHAIADAAQLAWAKARQD